jgi:hypothetical protein
MQRANVAPLPPATRPEVKCPTCRSKIFDGLVIKGISVIRLPPEGAAGLCKKCKAWVRLPLFYSA